jgi:trypsin
MKVLLALVLCVAVVQATEWPVRRYKPNKWNLTPPRVHKDRIVGGWDANIEDHPYQLSLQWQGFHICGGSIISATWSMSAAHCFLDDDLPSDVS